tara:strand:+ start:3494 stop:4282 length:789 start_codon:yes stop_codon:yes gene_type:complete
LYNFVLKEFHQLVFKLSEVRNGAAYYDRRGEPLTDDLTAELSELLSEFADFFERFSMRHALACARHLVSRQTRLSQNPGELAIRIQTLHDAIVDDVDGMFLFLYQDDRASVLRSIDSDWADVFKAFPSIEPEIRPALDLWASGHPTASVFHFMRACELGLRALARDLGITFHTKPMEWGTWGSLLKPLGEKLDELKKTTSGPKRDSDFEFYSRAVLELTALNGVRDQVMHVRKGFLQADAEMVREHVKNFFDNLATRLTDQL